MKPGHFNFEAEINFANVPVTKHTIAKIKHWLTDTGITEEDKREIFDLCKTSQASHMDELNDRFYKNLEFGTGGMRGVLGNGLNRMNIYTVQKAIQGLANYILKTPPSEISRGVAIAYDSRQFSEEFAHKAACVLAANQIPVFLFPHLEATPLLSFAIRHLKCLSGICITASHNPPKYNGLKMYWQDGAQLVSPQDQAIVEQVNAIENFSDIKTGSFTNFVNNKLIRFIDEDLYTQYDTAMQKLSVSQPKSKQNLSIVYTPLHGTGKYAVSRALAHWGFSNVFIVPEQAEPNGLFPTVKQPNPEDPKALTLALEYAEQKKSDVVFATDPDSDRLAMAIYDPSYAHGVMKHQSIGNYVLFNGNQLGALLINYILSSKQRLGTLKPQHKVIKTIVTSDLHTSICNHYHTDIFQTLTGFKWIASLIKKWETTHPDYDYLFGTEESFGFMPCNNVRDKDGVSALCLAAEMVAYLKDQHKTACDELFELFTIHGTWQEDLISIDLYGEEGLKKIDTIMEHLRQFKTGQPFAGVQIDKILDYTQETTYHAADCVPSNVLQFLLHDGSKISARPSGTEPKLKIYISTCLKPESILSGRTRKEDGYQLYQQVIAQKDLFKVFINEFVKKLV